MASQDAQSLQLAITQYETQVQAAMSAASAEECIGLASLATDIQELISLTKENLLTLRKQELLASLPSLQETGDPLDSEYLLFKAELGETKDEKSTLNASSSVPDIGADLQALEGMKCQAPYRQQYGESSFHNAMVSAVDTASSEGATNMQQIQVRIIFINPTHQAMRLCPYYLDGRCRFEDDKCRFSHGELVSLSDLREYKEPDFSTVHAGKRVLARGAGELWHCATVQALESSSGDGGQQDICHVRYETTGEEAVVELQSVLPLSDGESCSESESSDDDLAAREEAEEEMAMMNNLLLNQVPSMALGGWEKHTKGIGSKLMAKMGYITGSGLGKNAEGRIEPVEAVMVPQGKSLDHCMRLKEETGDSDIFKAEKRLKRQRRQRARREHQQRRNYEQEKHRTKGNVFDFINSYLTDPSTSQKVSGPSLQLSKSSKECQKPKDDNPKLTEQSRRGLNVRGMRLGEDIRRVEREISSLRQSLVRHSSKESPARKAIEAKVLTKQGELATLKKEENSVNAEQGRRQDRKKMAIF